MSVFVDINGCSMCTGAGSLANNVTSAVVRLWVLCPFTPERFQLLSSINCHNLSLRKSSTSAVEMNKILYLFCSRKAVISIYTWPSAPIIHWLLRFLYRDKGRSDREGFWPHNVNLQFAAMEITDEKFLKPIFEVAGGHAHSPPGMLANETLSICTPYIAGTGTNHMKVLSLLFLLFLSGQTLM